MMLLHPPHASLFLHEIPGTFSALMELYERNYISIRRLIPTMPRASTMQISRIPGGLDLHLHVIERFRYTSELRLTYRFTQDETAIAEPDLHIRVYHDARLVEVMAAHLRHQAAFNADILASQRPNRAELYTRWRINRFLDKWLNYCLHQGHRFSKSTPANAET
ncbi:MAG: DUF1249 domain-containing protein [Candidatus Competibacteraceae bacterium]